MHDDDFVYEEIRQIMDQIEEEGADGDLAAEVWQLEQFARFIDGTWEIPNKEAGNFYNPGVEAAAVAKFSLDPCIAAWRGAFKNMVRQKNRIQSDLVFEMFFNGADICVTVRASQAQE